MKKAFFLTVLFTLLAGSVFAASLKVLQPNGGEELRLGQAYQIKWTATDVGQKVKLVLMRHGGKVGIIDDGLDAGSSPYNWTVGQYHAGTATAGEGYQIRVRTMDDEVQDFSDGFFSLMGGAQPAGTIKIIKPAGGETICRGRFYQGQWQTTGAITQLELVAWINGQWRRLEGPFANSGAIQYAVPADSLPGTYRLRLQTLDGASFDEVSIQVADCGPSTYPDLTVTGARYEGGVVKATVKNLGESYTGPLCLRPVIPAFGQIKDHIYPVRTMEKNGESTCSISVPGWPDGIDCLPGSVEVDPKHAIVESNEDNNRFSGQICNPAVQGNLPDFRIKSFTPLCPDYSIELANDGGEYSGKVHIKIIAMDKLAGGQVAFSEVVSTCDKQVAAHSTVSLVSKLFDMIDYPGVCSFTFGLLVDPDREIPEANEDNNFFEKTLFANEGGGIWRQVYPQEVRIGKSNLYPLPAGGTRILPSETVNIQVPLQNCHSRGMAYQIVFHFAGREIARFDNLFLKSCEKKEPLCTIHLTRQPEFKPLEIFVLDEDDPKLYRVPDFEAQVRVD